MAMLGKHSRRRGDRVLCRAVSRAWVDLLEQRRLLAAGPLEVWAIHGTAGDDAIDIEFADDDCTQVVVTVNDKEVGTRAVSMIQGFSILCGNGDDNVYIALDDNHAIPATIDGGAGNDTIYSDWGNDLLIGGPGNDWMDGYYGADTLNGGGGADELHGSGGDDSLDGGGGNDSVYAGEGDDSATGGAGDDDLYGNAGDDQIDGGSGSDDIWGNAGDDSLGGDAGSDDIYGGTGDDSLSGDAGNDDLSGGAGGDTLSGDTGNDDLSGGTGSDDLDGDAGNDDLDGGVGDDDLTGGVGNDSLDGDAGQDSLDGDAGNDSLSGDGGNDDLDGGSGSDSLDGDAGDDSLDGDAGNDTLSGDDGNDSVSGDDGNDNISGDVGNDTLSGDGGTDSVSGGAGDDELHGGTGDDVLNGGAGMDTIYRWAGDKTIGDNLDQWRNDFRDSPVQSLNDPAWIEQIRQSLIDQAVQRYSYYLGQDNTASTYEIRKDGEAVYWNDVPWVDGEPIWYHPYYEYWCRGNVCYNCDSNATGTTEYLSSGTTATVTASSNATDSESYSTTNNQVQGVEEGDMVQTDGRYIYLLSGRNIQIIDARPADQTHEIASITLPNGVYGSALYIDGDRLTVVSTHYEGAPDRGEYADLFWWYSYFGTTTATDVTVYDVASRSTPQVVSQTEFDGYCSGSRDIGGQIYLVTGNTLVSPEPEYQLTFERSAIERPVVTPVEEPADTSDADSTAAPADESADTTDTQLATTEPIRTLSYYYDSLTPEDVYAHLPEGYGIYSVSAHRTIESADAYRARLEALPVESFLPQFATTDAAGQTVASGAVAGIDRLYAQSKPDSQASIFSVVKIDATGEAAAPADSLMIMGQSGQVYMTQQSLYVAAATYDYVSNLDAGSSWRSWASQWQARTDIYKISLDADRLEFAAAGQVPGSIHDQFSMDEYDGRLRIVTTTGQWTGASASHLFVLEAQGPTLELVGVLTGMGIGESVYATRFVGDRAYVVTFKQTDPLHVIDLSDPTKPRLAGVLHIPGYSSYLQPVGDHLLLGIGRDATDTGRVTGLQLSLFDVSDSANPKRVSQLKFDAGDWGSWASYSDALWDHKAFNYFPEQGILALPFGQYNYDPGNYSCSWENQLELVHVDRVTGLTVAASVDVDSSISRTLRIGGNIYSVSYEGVRVASLADPATVIAHVDRQWADSSLVLNPIKTRWQSRYYGCYWDWYCNGIFQPVQMGTVHNLTANGEFVLSSND